MSLTETENIMMAGWGEREIGRCWSKGKMVKVKSVSYVRWSSSGDLTYSMVTIVNNTVLYTWYLLKR